MLGRVFGVQMTSPVANAKLSYTAHAASLVSLVFFSSPKRSYGLNDANSLLVDFALALLNLQSVLNLCSALHIFIFICT